MLNIVMLNVLVLIIEKSIHTNKFFGYWILVLVK
jgi:hypothetical protein